MKSFSIKKIIWNIILITAGSFLYAIDINAILVPFGFLSDGIIGVTKT